MWLRGSDVFGTVGAVGYWAHSGIFRDQKLMATLAAVGNEVRRSLVEPVATTGSASWSTMSTSSSTTTGEEKTRAPPKPVEFEAGVCGRKQRRLVVTRSKWPRNGR